MLITIIGRPDAGKTTFARHVGNLSGGSTVLVAFEGNPNPRERETVIKWDGKTNPTEFMKENIKAIMAADTVIIDSISAVQDGFEPVALEACLQDDKLKSKPKDWKDKATLSDIPFAMGPLKLSELTKQFVMKLHSLSSLKKVIVLGHMMQLSITDTDGATADLWTIKLGGKGERTSGSRDALQQHSDALVLIDATPLKVAGKQQASRRAIVGQNPTTATKFKSELFGFDEFFTPEEFYDIQGKEALQSTIQTLNLHL